MGSVLPPLSLHCHLPPQFKEHQSQCSLPPARTVQQAQTKEPIISPTTIITPVQWDIMTEITHTQTHDPPPPECPPSSTYVPLMLRKKVTLWDHSSLSSGHLGTTATLQLLYNQFWWPIMQADTISYVQNCSTCNINKSSKQLPAGLLRLLPIPQHPWFHVAIDFVTDLPSSQRHTTILTIIDLFSKACHLIPLPKLPTTFETAKH